MWIGFLAALLALTFGAATPCAFARAAPQDVTQAWFLNSASTEPPASDADGWQRRQLPDDWDSRQPGVGGPGWYRIDFTLEALPAEPWAVHISRLRMNAAAWVNGSFVGDGGRLIEPIARNWNRPLYFLVPTGLLRPGINVVHLRVLGDPNLHAGLFGLQVGADEALRAGYERSLFFKITLNQALFVMSLAMAALMGLLWLRRRTETIYGWFALTCLLWAANSTHFFVRELPFDTWTWEWFAQTTTDWFAVLLAISMHRFLGLRRPRLERVFVAYGVAGSLILSVVELDRMFAVANLLHGGAVLIVSYVVAFTAWRAWKERRRDEIVLAVGMAGQGSLGLHDWILQIGWLSATNWYLLHYGAPVLLATMAWLLTSRFVRALGESQALNAELEQRVAARGRELEHSYQRMQFLQREQVVAQERERIMRDLHDGLGGQLVSALALAQQGKEPAIQQTLRDALDDLRLVIDSLDPTETDIPVLLGTVRGRLESRLAQQGLRFEWQVMEVPAIPGFGPDKALQVLRILQEAIANILKHAQARTVTVRTGMQPGIGADPASVYIEVVDDGIGMPPAPVCGRGLGNMRERAQRIGARLDLDSSAGGTAVRLRFPLPAAA